MLLAYSFELHHNAAFEDFYSSSISNNVFPTDLPFVVGIKVNIGKLFPEASLGISCTLKKNLLKAWHTAAKHDR